MVERCPIYACVGWENGEVRVSRLNGVVETFDHHEGLGWIADEVGTRYLFHCAELTDGTRDVAVGSPVTFESVVRFGHLEATLIDKI